VRQGLHWCLRGSLDLEKPSPLLSWGLPATSQAVITPVLCMARLSSTSGPEDQDWEP
jgi:hypothetical protein